MNKLLTRSTDIPYALYKFREKLSLIYLNSISAYASVLDIFSYVGIRWLKLYSLTGP